MDKHKRGLERRYRVDRLDGSDAPGGPHHGERYFVLAYDSDPYARMALVAYADACEEEYPVLASELRSALRSAQGIVHDHPTGVDWQME